LLFVMVLTFWADRRIENSWGLPMFTSSTPISLRGVEYDRDNVGYVAFVLERMVDSCT
jgi:hypothetical protein